MNIYAAIGFISFGTFVGTLIGWSTSGTRELDAKGYGGLISAAVGVLVGFIPLFAPTPVNEWWLYPIGLLLGLFWVSPFSDIQLNRYYERSDRKDKGRKARARKRRA